VRHEAAAIAGLSRRTVLVPSGSADVRDYAIICLQRALLSPPFARMSGASWEACFEKVSLPSDQPTQPID
jgi:hypothetical protein